MTKFEKFVEYLKAEREVSKKQAKQAVAMANKTRTTFWQERFAYTDKLIKISALVDNDIDLDI
jgi:hypothetical protein